VAPPIAVTGAGGFVGGRLARHLRAAGAPVRALIHSARDADALRALGCEVREADVLDREALAEAFAGCRAVVHLVAIIRERGGLTFDVVNRQGAANAASAAAAAGAGRLIHLSALGAAPGAPRYLRSKWEGEEAVRAAGLPAVIFRPSILLGPGGGAAAQFADVVRYGLWYPLAGRRPLTRQLAGVLAAVTPVVPVLGDGRYTSMPVALDDLVPAVVSSLERDDVLGRTFEIGGPEVLSYNELIRRAARVLGLRRLLWHIPRPAARALLRLFALLPTPPITRDEFDALLIDNVCDPGPAVRTFGLRLRPVDQALREALTTAEEKS
jgi:NADH dehydrogenase